MPDRDHVFTVVAEWVAKADNDLKTAAKTGPCDGCHMRHRLRYPATTD